MRYSWDVRTVCRLRGRFRLGPITLSSGDPFGLFVFHRTLRDTEKTLVVYPLTIESPFLRRPLAICAGAIHAFNALSL